MSSDGTYAHCTRLAGDLEPSRDGSYAHRLDGECRCGQQHGQVQLEGRHERRPDDRFANAEVARFLWDRGRSAAGTLVERYLSARGLTGPIPSSLRFLPSLKHGPSGLRLPAMVGAVAVWPGRQPVAIQRTWLCDDGGKADVQPPRMSLGPIAGGAVRLAAPGGVLVVAEGIETALSVQQETGLPAWASLGAANMAGLVLPDLPLAEDVVIAVDNDPDGIKWAHVAARRWTAGGRRVRLALPPDGARDFNDALRVAA